MSSAAIDTELLTNTRTNTGETLAALSEKSPVLLVLLRHEGCPFCRNAMHDIARLHHQIEDVGTSIVFGHMTSADEFATFAARYGLSAIPAVADPQRKLYQGMGLQRASVLRLLSPKVFWAYMKSIFSGHRPGKIKGDPFQPPGAFLLHMGKVIKSHLYRNVGDRPDYVSLATP
jgi:peroxiredoxin